MNSKLFNEDDIKILFPDNTNMKDTNFDVELEDDSQGEKPEQRRDKPEVTPLKPVMEQKTKLIYRIIKNIYFKFSVLFIALFFASYAITNWSAIAENIKYIWNVNIQNKVHYSKIVPPTPAPTLDPTTPAKLIIPKIGVDVPISWNVSDNMLQEKLLEGAVHSKGTAYPGQKGNIFITGHSSYYSWSTSPYKDIFALLDKLDIGDKIYIQYNNTSFAYEVTESKVVSPQNIEVMEQSNDYRLTLMTCVPIGTNLNRLIITSVQITN